MKFIKELLFLKEQAEKTVDESSSLEQLIHAKHEITHKLRKTAGKGGLNKKDLENELARLDHLITVKRIRNSRSIQENTEPKKEPLIISDAAQEKSRYNMYGAVVITDIKNNISYDEFDKLFKLLYPGIPEYYINELQNSRINSLKQLNSYAVYKDVTITEISTEELKTADLRTLLYTVGILECENDEVEGYKDNDF